ncbi:hypothetical protein IV102_15560 [bacterium]|nr:hypothetical protein [bacterium]
MSSLGHNGAMVIQSNRQPIQRQYSAGNNEEVDEDPWSGYQDTLELDAAPSLQAPVCLQDDFAAAQARLEQRGQALQQQSARQMQQRSAQPNYFPHLQGQGVNSNAGRVYGSQPGYYQPRVPVIPSPTARPSIAPVQARIDPDPVDQGVQPTQSLPYEIDAWGNPILPENAELDVFGNMFFRYS